MGKFFLNFLFLLLITITLLIIYLSYFGIKTDKFDHLIKNKANEVNQYIKLEFKKTKIHLNPTELNLIVKLQNPKILIRNNYYLFTLYASAPKEGSITMVYNMCFSVV